MKKTKIICTLGPAVDSVEGIAGLLRAGMDGARFNFSHGSHESHLATLERLEAACAQTGRVCARILDTKGPEIRIKTFRDGPIQLRAGDEFTLRTDEVEGDAGQVSVTYPSLGREIGAGCRILIDDGLVCLRVKEIDGPAIRCTVESGGILSNNKSINIPGVSIRLPALTDRDREDLRFAAEHDFDFIAASFVRSAADVAEVRAELRRHGGSAMIISKIENQQGVDALDEIIDASDGVMVARGDLGVEIPAAKVPILQKKIIRRCREKGKIVIVATQMLDSMIHAPRPTRAEVSDVANAVYDGAGCVMLSGETASGKYPIESLSTMYDIICEAEAAIDYWSRFRDGISSTSHGTISDAITHTCCLTAADLGAAAILTATQSGYTARMLARFLPQCPILALSTQEKVRRQLCLSWGVYAFPCAQFESTDAIFGACTATALTSGMAKKGDTVVMSCGVPIGKSGSTNLLKAETL
ncbi:MAG: pyruvate kinase [Oscillospiraceae bacterium]